MRNTLLALALVKTLWDTRRKDYLDAFLPLLALLLQRHNIAEFRDLRPIQQQFHTAWGLSIPYQAVASIVNRARKRGLLTRSAGVYYSVPPRLREECSQASAEERHDRVTAMLSHYSNFAAQEGVDLDAVQLEAALISYLRRQSADLHMVLGTDSPLPDLQTTHQALYLFARFASEAKTSHPDDYRTLVELWFGHAIVNAVVLPEAASLTGKLHRLALYLDAPFIFAALGYSGGEAQDAAVELLHAVKGSGASLRMFHHTYDEVFGILESTTPWLTNLRDYDPSKASLTLRHFMDMGFKPSDVEAILSHLPSRLQSLAIELQAAPGALDNIRYQINESQLEAIIRTIYRSTPTDYTIQRDIHSIAAIYRLRRDHLPRRITETKHVFLTPNHSLALASRRYERQYISDSFFIPAAVTDIFLGTILWLESPQSLEKLSQLQLMSDVQALLEPREDLLRRFSQAVKELADRGQITADEFLVLRTSRVARSLLQELTLGDPESFSHRTPEEILQQIKDAARQEERTTAASRETLLREQYLAEKARHLSAVGESEQLDAQVRKVCNRIALVIAILVFVVLATLWIAVFTWISAATDATGWRRTAGVIATILLSAVTLIIPIRDVLGISSKLRTGIARVLLRSVFRRV